MSLHDETETLSKEIEILKGSLKELMAQKERIELRNCKRLNELFDRIEQLDSWGSFINDIADLPGVRQPKWYKVSVPFEYGDKQENSRQVQISPTGPFVCTQMQTYFKVTDSNPEHYAYYFDLGTNAQDPTIPRTTTAVGRTLSSTSYFGLPSRELDLGFLDSTFPKTRFLGELYSNYVDGATPYIGEGWNYPEFDIRIQTASNNSYWTGTKGVPAAAFYGQRGPLYTGIPSIVKATDSLVVFAKPSSGTVNLAGEFIFEFHGYQINAHLNLENLLGV